MTDTNNKEKEIKKLEFKINKKRAELFRLENEKAQLEQEQHQFNDNANNFAEEMYIATVARHLGMSENMARQFIKRQTNNA